ncbi:MAG TPA: FecR domain-containing protein [Flavobacterium sp.]|jgi:ferric-dicitrate binding protein FerR (iron transport regulator)
MKEQDHNLSKWLSGEMSESERIAFENSPEYDTYNRIAKYSAQLQAPSFEESIDLKNIVSRPKQKTIKLKIDWAARIAAILVVGAGLFLIWSNMTVTESAQSGQMSSFTLPDQSSVQLNAGSVVNYKKWNWKNNRSLSLTGEAYFKVAKGEKFKVETPVGKVTVLGTQFNVKSRGNQFEVACFEGRVQVDNKKQTTIIGKGEKVIVENGQFKKYSISDSSPEWTRGKMTFDSAKLRSIVTEIERQYGIAVEVKDSDESKTFTGTLPTDNQQIALAIIGKTFNLNISKAGTSKVILEGR